MNENILVVDDEVDILNSIGTLFSREGFNVKTCSDTEQAIQLFKAEPFDLVVSDVRMPKIDGLQFMNIIKKIDEDIEVIFMTGFASIDNAVQAMRYNGAFDYLTKPLDDIDKLCQTAKNALANRKLRMESKELLNKLETINSELQENLKERTQRLKQTEATAELVHQTTDNYLNIINHELRTPLNPILVYSNLLLNKSAGPLTARQEKYLITMEKAAKQLLSVFEDILNFLASAAGKIKENFTEVDLHLLLNRILVENQAKAEGYRIDLTVTPDIYPTTVKLDESMFKLVLNHLIANAIKFTEKNGIVKIGGKFSTSADYFKIKEVKGAETPCDTGILEISVSDTGIGIEKKHLEEIFEPFKRIKADNKKLYDGIGLGLSICKKYVETLGGKIWAESEGLGNGTTVRFIIPI